MPFHTPKLEGRYRTIFKILGVILVLNWLVAFAKIIYGWITQSGSMLADGIHSLSDGASNIIGMTGIWMASAPPDKEHPYGHKKFETFAALAISTFLLVICVFLVFEAISRFHSRIVPEVTTLSFIVMVVTMAINIGVTWYERKRGHELNSDILKSDALHTGTDVLTSAAVIVSLIGVKMGLPHIDPIITLIIAGFVAWGGFGIIKESSDVLLDRIVLDHSLIQKVVLKEPKIKACHEIRTRGRKDDVHVDLHILVDNEMPIREAHDLANYIEIQIKKNIEGVTDVVVHIEPESHEHPPGFCDKN